MQTINLIGFAGGAAANNVDCALGPWYWYYHPELFNQLDVKVNWRKMVHYTSNLHGIFVKEELFEALQELEQAVAKNLKSDKTMLVLGGDHSCAMGTWQGVAKALNQPFGLIWIDAHLDSHTPEDSSSKNFHGMPMAYLLGLWGDRGILNPESVCVVGGRSYESEELANLQRLGVKMMLMQEVKQKGIEATLKECVQHIQKQTHHIGLSIDFDAFSPKDAPGVGCPEPMGLDFQKFLNALEKMKYPWLMYELAEFNPLRDKHHKTADCLPRFLRAILR